MKKLSFLAVLLLIVAMASAQNSDAIPVQVKEQFPDFELVDANGARVLSMDFSGKNIMLVFPRGRVTDARWCPICHYQYLEILELEKAEGVREKYNMEILFVLPYSRDSLGSWMSSFEKSIRIVEGWKYPKNEKGVSAEVKAWADYCLDFFPETYSDFPMKPELPILFDEDHSLSDGLRLYKEEWGGTKMKQNIPAIYIVGSDRKVKFKYFSQYTNDRPSADYLLKVMECML